MNVIETLKITKHALNQTWQARAISINLFSTFSFFAKCLAGKDEEAIYKFRLGKMQFLTRAADWYSVQEVVIEHEYNFINSIFQNKKQQLTVVDIGANIGMFSIYILAFFPYATVYAFEPCHHTYMILEKNKSLNSCQNWYTYRYAVWKENSNVGFENRRYSTSNRISHDGKEIVPAINLSTLFSRYIKTNVDLLKMDIEGAEEFVICDNVQIFSAVNHLVVELHPQVSNQNRVVSALRSAYKFLYYISGRRSSKPLLLASHYPYPLPQYTQQC